MRARRVGDAVIRELQLARRMSVAVHREETAGVQCDSGHRRVHTLPIPRAVDLDRARCVRRTGIDATDLAERTRGNVIRDGALEGEGGMGRTFVTEA